MSAKELQEMENPVTRGAKGAEETCLETADPGTGLFCRRSWWSYPRELQSPTMIPRNSQNPKSKL